MPLMRAFREVLASTLKQHKGKQVLSCIESGLGLVSSCELWQQQPITVSFEEFMGPLASGYQPVSGGSGSVGDTRSLIQEVGDFTLLRQDQRTQNLHATMTRIEAAVVATGNRMDMMIEQAIDKCDFKKPRGTYNVKNAQSMSVSVPVHMEIRSATSNLCCTLCYQNREAPDRLLFTCTKTTQVNITERGTS